MPTRWNAAMLAAVMLAANPAASPGQEQPQGGAHSERQAPKPPDSGAEKKLTPEQTMAARFPHPAKVGFLVGLPILDWNDSTLGYVRHVVRTPEGKVQLIASYGGWAGGYLNWGGRLIAIPIEAVQILGRQIGVTEIPVEDLDKTPTWSGGNGQVLGGGESIRIALARR